MFKVLMYAQGASIILDKPNIDKFLNSYAHDIRATATNKTFNQLRIACEVPVNIEDTKFKL